MAPAAHARRHELDRPAAVPGAPDEALFLQVGEVLVDVASDERLNWRPISSRLGA
jgi:hypothetical protein